MSSPITARTLIPPSGAIAFNASGGKSRSAGSATARKIANGIALFQRELAGDQAFHVDRRRFRGAAQLRLGGGGQNRSVGGGEGFDKRARSGVGAGARRAMP